MQITDLKKLRKTRKRKNDYYKWFNINHFIKKFYYLSDDQARKDFIGRAAAG